MYAIMLAGALFTFASAQAWVGLFQRGAFAESAITTVMRLGLFGLTSFWLLCSVSMLFWPLLSSWVMRNTIAIITDRRVIRCIKLGNLMPRFSERSLWACRQPSITRRRNGTATLVLSEQLKRRPFDGKIVYRWDRLHGLPDADAALSALIQGQRANFRDDGASESHASISH